MKQTKELAYLRQLCCLGLPKESIIPEFLQAITRVIPSHHNTYSGIDPSEFKPGETCVLIDDVSLINTIQHVLNEYWIPERTQRVAAWFQRNLVLTEFTVFDKNYLNSDLYNLVLKPLDQHQHLLGFFKDHVKPLGAINLFRTRTQKPFDTKEQALFVHLLPYVSHAIQNQNTHDLQYVSEGITGMFLMDMNGCIQYQNATAAHLWLLAHDPLMATGRTLNTNAMLPQLRQLCQNLNALFVGKDAPPPSFCHINGCGRFVFSAFWLDKANREPGGLIGVIIEHQEPQRLSNLRALRDLPLSPAQREVALLVAEGMAYEKIGEQLHIKLTTVKDHVYKIFDKLDIDRREDLLSALITKEKTYRLDLDNIKRQ